MSNNIAEKSLSAHVNMMNGLHVLLPVVTEIAGKVVRAYQNGNKLMLCGNGGSAADSQHLAAELVGRFYKERSALSAIALSTNTSILTAIGNDYSYDDVFSRQIEAIGIPGDILVGITTSGNSPNIIRAVQTAKSKGVITIGLTGHSGGRLKSEADHCLCVPSSDTPRIQEAHILMGHIMCEIVEETLFR